MAEEHTVETLERSLRALRNHIRLLYLIMVVVACLAVWGARVVPGFYTSTITTQEIIIQDEDGQRHGWFYSGGGTTGIELYDGEGRPALDMHVSDFAGETPASAVEFRLYGRSGENENQVHISAGADSVGLDLTAVSDMVQMTSLRAGPTGTSELELLIGDPATQTSSIARLEVSSGGPVSLAAENSIDSNQANALLINSEEPFLSFGAIDADSRALLLDGDLEVPMPVLTPVIPPTP